MIAEEIQQIVEENEIDDSPTISTSTSSSSFSDSTDSGVPSLLSRLRQVPLAIINRKIKVAQNLPSERKCHKARSRSNDPKRVTPEQRVKELFDEKLVVSAGKLFCTACKEEVALKKRTSVSRI